MINNSLQQQSVVGHCIHAFSTLIAYLTNNNIPTYPKTLPNYVCPLFVTWKINGDELRGCIGTFSGGSLDKLIGKYALTAALQDSRFNPISLEEVESLSVSVSLLVSFEDGKNAYDWEINKHGIIIDFKDNKDYEYNATYLPEVAGEQGWTQDDTLKSLIRKAGYKGNWKDVVSNIKLTRYQSSKCELSYSDYSKLMKQQTQQSYNQKEEV